MPKPPLDNLPLEWVRAFEAAARTGSFTEAASETGITQSAISQRIGNLEARLGTQLFHRQPRRVVLTVAGETWLPYVGAALRSLGESAEAVFGHERNRLTVLASASIIELWLAPRLHRLPSSREMQIAFRTLALSSEKPPADTQVEIRYGTGDWPAQHKAPLFTEAMAPLAAPSLATEGASWQTLPRIAVLGPRPGWKDWAEQRNAPMTPVPRLRFDTFALALAAARAGAGVLLASLPLCKADLRDDRLRVLSTPPLEHHETYWMTAPQKAVSPRQWADLTAAFCEPG